MCIICTRHRDHRFDLLLLAGPPTFTRAPRPYNTDTLCSRRVGRSLPTVPMRTTSGSTTAWRISQWPGTTRIPAAAVASAGIHKWRSPRKDLSNCPSTRAGRIQRLTTSPCRAGPPLLRPTFSPELRPRGGGASSGPSSASPPSLLGLRTHPVVVIVLAVFHCAGSGSGAAAGLQRWAPRAEWWT